MKHLAQSLLCALAATLFAAAAAAQSGPKGNGSCAQARDMARCEALRIATETCKDMVAAEKRLCIQNALPPLDCSRTRDSQRCEAHRKAKEICKGTVGREHRQCLHQNMPKHSGKKSGKKSAAKT